MLVARFANEARQFNSNLKLTKQLSLKVESVVNLNYIIQLASRKSVETILFCLMEAILDCREEEMEHKF